MVVEGVKGGSREEAEDGSKVEKRAENKAEWVWLGGCGVMFMLCAMMDVGWMMWDEWDG
jgi:hypothetical protein